MARLMVSEEFYPGRELDTCSNRIMFPGTSTSIFGRHFGTAPAVFSPLSSSAMFIVLRLGWRGGRDFKDGDPMGLEETSCCSMALICEWK
ncbi:hypothetical protein TNCV_1597421 [Trichonephila clavipes]|nr:hypothetical protein TNCV_1597421 [Trichonephila clavipes]